MRIAQIIIYLFILTSFCFSQVENVPLSYPVYDFLKEMSVKKVISNYNDDNPNLSRFEVAEILKIVDSKKNELSTTEKSLLDKFKIEFIPEEANSKNTWQMFGNGKNFIKNLGDFFSNKQKYLFSVGKEGNNAFIEGVGNIYVGHQFKADNKINTLMMDGGFRARGTIFNHLGYYFDFYKGAIIGQKELAPYLEPKVRADFKFNENTEKVLNYDFTNAYLKFFIEPAEKMRFSAQFGREKLTLGYGYGSKTTLSGDNPDMDFLKMNFDYGILHYTSIFASTVGYFSVNRDDRYTKYFSSQRIKLSFKDVIDVGISDVVIYNGRIDFAYLNPILFWHFAEKSLQDRDNKNIVGDFQTKFLKNVEFQGTLFMDDDEGFTTFTGKTNKNQKFAYQIGTFIYEPFSIKNLSLVLEYTKIRPYTYSHYDLKNNYTAYGLNLGHRIGPNADEIMTRLTYNISDWGRFNVEFRHIRKGNNVYDDNGNLIKNVGGDVAIAYRNGIDDENATFLDGERVNTEVITLNFRWIPIRNYTFNFYYVYNLSNNLTKGSTDDFSYAFVRLNIDY